VLVLHERKSRVTLAARLAGKTAAEIISVMLAVFARIEPALRKSITFDNDTAFAQPALLRTMRAMTTRFCDAYASWQRAGSKTPTVDQVSDEEIQDIVITANLTPRKCLGFRRANPVLITLLHLDLESRSVPKHRRLSQII
jgi:IS30 family transposase